MNYLQHNEAINGFYWNDVAWRRLSEFWGCTEKFLGLEHGLKKLSDSQEIKRVFRTAKARRCLVVGPQVKDLGEDIGPFLYLNLFEPRGEFRSYFSWFINYERPPLELHQSLVQREIHGFPMRVIFNIDVEHRDESDPASIINDQLGRFAMMEPHKRTLEGILVHHGVKFLTEQTGKGYQMLAQTDDINTYNVLSEIAGPLEHSLLVADANRGVSEFTERINKGMRRLELFVNYMALNALMHHNVLPSMLFYSKDCEQVDFDAMAITKSCFNKGFASIGTPYNKFEAEKDFKGYASQVTGAKIPFRILRGKDGVDIFNLEESIYVRNDYGSHIDSLHTQTYHIPDASLGIRNLAASFYHSELKRKVFDVMDETEHDPQNRWPDTYWNYDAITQRLPQISYFFDAPNHFMFRNEAVDHVFSTLLYSGWHPKHIAGLFTAICSDPKYDFGPKWKKDDAATYCNGLVEILLTDKLIKGELPW